MSYDYELSDEAEKVLQSVIAMTSLDAGALISEAVSILDLVMTAKLEGKKILIADHDGVPLQEVDLLTPKSITKKQLELVLSKIDSEGFDYCFRGYSSFKEITDAKFRKAYDEYITAANTLEGYIKKEARLKGAKRQDD